MNGSRFIDVGTNARLRLMATTDLHMHLTSYDYRSNREDPSVGMTRTATLIRNARREAERDGMTCFLFDNGDSLQGTPLADLVRHRPDRPHPMMRAFGTLRYDAIGLGNHDFDFGLKPLSSAIAQAPCPVLSTNTTCHSPAQTPCFSRFAILDRIVQIHSSAERVGDPSPTEPVEVPIRLGILSFLPPQTLMWNTHLPRHQLEIADIVDSARASLSTLQTLECDIIVALCHAGISRSPAHHRMENAVLPLAEIDGIDVIIAGHSHMLLPGLDFAGIDGLDHGAGKVRGKPVVMAGAAGSHLGLIDLDLKRRDSGWEIARSRSSLRAIARRTSEGQLESLAEQDPELVAQLAEDHADTIEMLNRPVGRVSQPLHSYFSFIAPDRSLATVAAAQAAALRPLLQGTPVAELPLLSATSPGRYGARSGPGNYTDVPAGPLALRHLSDLQTFQNDLHAVMVSGGQLVDWLEMSACLFRQIPPGAEHAALIDPELPGHEFDVIYGLTYVIDLAAPPRFEPDGTLRPGNHRRIRDLCHKGQPVDDDDVFAVALNSFRAAGGRFKVLENARHLPVDPVGLRSVLRAYLAGKLPRDPLESMPHPWRFAPMPGTSVSLQTGPDAQRYLEEIAPLDVTSNGIDECGFLRLSLPL